MNRKQRLSASVDAELIREAESAVARGRSQSLSAWVNDALRLKLDHDKRLAALAVFIASYEADHGEITDEEMRLAARRARAKAIPARALPAGRARRSRRRTGT